MSDGWALADALQREVDELREMLEWCARRVWECGNDIDGGDFQDEMEARGLMVSVPASEEIRDEYQCDTMLALRWSALAEEAGATATAERESTQDTNAHTPDSAVGYQEEIG